MKEIQNPLISVITVCLNSDKTIRDTIESVLNQTYNNIEYILIDGNSTDNTLAIITSYKVEFKKRGINYKWISEPDGGIYEAMNKGVALAIGEFIGIIGADDWYEPRGIEIIVAHYKKTSADYIHGNIRVYSPTNVFLKERKAGTKTEMIKRMSFFHPSSFIKRKIYKDLDGYYLKYKICSDYDFILRIINNDYSISYVDQTLANHSYGGISTTEIKKALNESHIIRVSNGYNSFLSKWYYYRALFIHNLKELFSD